MVLNKYQTQLDSELVKSLDKDVYNDLMEYINGIIFIQNIISVDRPTVDKLDKDSTGKVFVDISNPHILENMDYFREASIHYKKHGVYTNLIPNSNPNSEYAKFWKEEIRRWEYGLVRPDGEWIPGGLYFYWNYSPIWISKEDGDKLEGTAKRRGKRKREFPTTWLGDYLFYHYMEQARNGGQHGKLLKCRGIGFEQPDSEKVKTYSGDKSVGDINVGDSLIDLEGLKTTVLEVYPQGKKDVYEVTLMDGRKSKCGLEHLWYVNDYTKKKIRAIKTSEMLEKGLYWKINNGKNKMYKYKIPKISPIQYPKKDLSVDPYVLGCLLGDGALTGTNIRIATDDLFIVEEFERRLPGYKLRRDFTNNNYTIATTARFNKDPNLSKYKNYKYGINILNREIGILGLKVNTSNKFIPEIYKLSSIKQRLELLQGLMDSDGSINIKGSMEFSNSNYQLIKDVADIVRSLGMKARLSKGRSPRIKNIRGKNCNIKQEYRLHIITNEIIFKLPRKVSRHKNRKLFEECSIVDIKKLDYKEKSSCFFVDNPTNTYLTRDYILTHNSFKIGSLSPRNMYIYPGTGNPNFHLASDKTFLIGDKGVFGKVLDVLDWIANNTPLPRLRITDSKKGMEVQLGYMDEYGGRKGLLSSVYGISLKHDPDKARGIRGPLIHYEEDGLFPDLEKAWGVNREAVEDGNVSFGFMLAGGTGGTEGASFEGSEKLFYQPNSYNILGVPNVYDKNSDGTGNCGFFWGAYLNRNGCYEKVNGEPDVIKALIEVIQDRHHIRKMSSDPRALTQRRAEKCITPQDAVMRVDGTLFPVSDLKDYLTNISINVQKFVSGHYVGRLSLGVDGKVQWQIDETYPVVRDFPIKNNLNKHGSVEIFEMPRKGVDGIIANYRYIAGIDPIDDDHSTTNSLASIFIFDRFTDKIVAEYTGRPTLANDFYEIALRLLKFYNAIANYENDKKGLFAYFSQKQALHYLCDNPEILKDMDMQKSTNYGNKSKGTNSGVEINKWGRRLQADWLNKIAYSQEEVEEDEEEIIINNLQKLRSFGYIKELIAWNPDGNFDRVSAMGMLMILKEDMAKYEVRQTTTRAQSIIDDPFFKRFKNNSRVVNFDRIVRH